MLQFISTGWNKMVGWYGTLTVYGTISVVVVLAAFGLGVFGSSDTATEEPTSDSTSLPVVTVSPAGLLANGTNSTLSLIGTVEASSQAKLVAERGGRITSQSVRLGQTVSAGQVILTLENVAERAQVTQAEGAYQAAVASQAQAGTTINDAQTNLQSTRNTAVTTFSSAYSALNQLFTSSIDQYYGDPSARIPGIRISGFTQTNYLNNERVAFQTLLADWQQLSSRISSNDANLKDSLQTGIAILDRTLALVDVFVTILPNQPTGAGTSGDQWRQQADVMIQTRNTVIQLRNNLQSSLSSITNAEETLDRAQIGGASSGSSLADAQITQALGSLQAAQANLSKTIIRTPISGTITTLPVRQGDNIAPQTLVAEVINDAAVEVITFINQSDLTRYTVGDEVTIDSSGRGIITAIAERIDSQTGKIEMRIASDASGLTPGATVRIFALDQTTESEATTELTLPLNTVRFIDEEAYVFVVVDAVLTLQKITVGPVSGSRILVTDGISSDTLIVNDARGKQVGQRVTIETQ